MKDERTTAADVEVNLPGLTAERGRPGEDLADLRQKLETRTRELEESEARFRDIIERNADAILVVGQDGVIRFANRMAATLFETPGSELTGRAFGFPVVVGETTELDLPSDGAVRVAEMRVVESRWEGRLAYIASMRDITERRRAEESARRLIQEQVARAAAEETARRFKFLVECSGTLSSSLDDAAVLPTLATLCISEIADWAVVYGLDESGSVRRLEVAHRDPSRAAMARRLLTEPVVESAAGLLAGILKDRKPLLAAEVSEPLLRSMTEAGSRDLLDELGVRSIIVVPMIARNHVLGAIMLVSANDADRFGVNDLALAEDLAFHAALAIDNARLYQEAQRANQTKSDFLAVISHDLRTPLNAIVGYADLLDEGIPDPLSDRSRESVRRIRTSAKHLNYLIKELLAFARLDAGHENASLREVDACEVVRDVAAVVEPIASERHLILRVNLPDAAVSLTTDPDKLRQILLNLVGNAVKYTEQGEVRLEVREHSLEGVVINVQDTGVGIAPEHVDRIFEPFWQVDPTQRTQGGGTGLGLSVVRRLVQLLGGAISVRSTVGVGSTFTVTLPRAAAMIPATRMVLKG